MDGGQRHGGRGGRRKKKRSQEARAVPEPVLIAARRPGAPTVVGKRPRSAVAASAAPRTRSLEVAPAPELVRVSAAAPKRLARIVSAAAGPTDDDEKQRLKLVAKVHAAQGRSAITRSVDELRRGGHALPEDQAFQLQLLEHMDEAVARDALEVLTRLIAREPAQQRPVFEQRLKRLEEFADDAATRTAAAQLRRDLRG
jgi:hypothetical protein